MMSYNKLSRVLVVALALFLPAAAFADTNRISDATVKTLVEREIARRGLPQVHVSVEDRIVTLDGEVASLSVKDKVERAAAITYSVSRVDNRLAVTRPASDETLASAVRRSILTHPNYDLYDFVSGSIEDGKVVLTGYVREPWRKEEFGKRLRTVNGVASVDNRIEVLPLSGYDDQLRIAAARLIYGHSTLSRYALSSNPPIRIIVNGGRITLLGAVGSAMDRQLAETALSGLTALEVRNELQVDSKG